MGASTDKYSNLLNVPKALSEEISRYEKKHKSIIDNFENTRKDILKEFDEAETTSIQIRENNKQEAYRRYKNWETKINKYKNKYVTISQTMNNMLGQALGVSIQSLGQAIGFLQIETQQRLVSGKQDDNGQIVNLCNKEIELEKEIQDTIEILAREVRSQRDNEVSLAEKSYREEHDAHIRKRDQALNRNTRIHELSLEHVDAEFAERVENLILPERVKHTFRRMQEEQPNYEVFEPAKDFPQGIQFGYAGYDITEHTKDELKNTVINKRFGYAVKEANGHKYLVMPYGYSFKDSHFSTLFEFTSASRDQAAETVRNIALNLFMSIPVNKCWCTFIDPVSQGNTFAVFSPMGEKDENGNGDERVIDIRIWSDDNQIEERLKLIVDHTADIIQHCLQGRYDNILDYNMDAGINAEPLRFLVVMDFPKHFTERSISYLESIIDNGPKTGVYTIIVADKIDIENQGEESPAHRIWNRIRNKVVVEDDILYIQESTRDGKMRYFPFSAPTNEQYIDIISEIRKHLGEEVVITYPMVSSNLPETPDYWFHRSAIDGISVPIGMEGAGKIINLEFGRKYHSFAAMIGGTTGAGKSSLMHTIIQSVIFNYSPEEVQMFLLDFKQGVEFKCYADLKLPNFRVISVETEPEFGLAVLNELHEEMVRRSSKFRSVGVGTIENYWRYRGERGESHADMPRLLIIFDEIQMLLFEAENEISQKCVARIKELVTQGVRAFGIHLILSTQTFENVKGLDGGVYSNIHTRIALKTTKASAELLLSNDNAIINRLPTMDVGQGVINNNAGDKDANRTFRAALITERERNMWMQQVREKQIEIMFEESEKPRILLSSPEDDSENPLNIFVLSGKRPTNRHDPSYRLYIGESLTMINTFFPALWNRRGQNLLVVGKDSEGLGLSRMVIGYSVLSLLHEMVRLKGEITSPFITIFDLSGNSIYGSRDFDMLDQIEATVPEAFRVIPITMILDGIEMLYRELEAGRRQFVIFYGLNRAKQLTTGTYQQSPKEQLEEMFSRGPENGMNFIVWANDPGLFIENYGAAMNSFDLRLAYGMEDKEYKAITGEAGPDVCSNMNVLSYNLIGDNQKIRMYARSTESWLNQFLKNIRRFVR